MKFLLITVGSRGDAEPFCALAERLVASSHHQVHLFLQDEHSPPSNVQTHTLPFTTHDFYRFVANPKHGSDDPNPRVRFVGVVADTIGELILPCYESVLSVAKDSNVDMIVTSSLARPLAFALSSVLNVPVAVIHLQPLCPTTAFPHYSSADSASVDAICNPELSGKAEHEESYWKLERCQHDFLQETLNSVREQLGLKPQEFDELRVKLSGNDDKTLIFNASPTIVPFVHTEQPYVFNVGPLGDGYIPNDWQGAPQDLVDFLQANPRPICIGFGSMPVLQRDAVKEVVSGIDRPVVLVGKAFVDDKDIAENGLVFAIDKIPYAWLLPQCSMMLCHGGAGVVAATLRAGIPCLVSPLIGDQFFMGSLLERRGLGVRVGESLSSMTSEQILEAIQRVTDDIIANAHVVGSEIQGGQAGVQRAVDAMEAYLKTRV